MQLFVRGLQGTLVVELAGGTSLAAVKQVVAARSGIPAAEQRYIHEGRVLTDGPVLAAQGVLPDATLHLSASLLGGMWPLRTSIGAWRRTSPLFTSSI